MTVSRRVEIGGLVADLATLGHEVRIRVTGHSMAPFLADCDVVTIRCVVPEELRVGDLVFTRGGDALPVLHRIIGIRRDGDGTRSFLTKGDALSTSDPPVSAKDVLGKVVGVTRAGKGPERRLDTLPRRLFGSAVAGASSHAPLLFTRLCRIFVQIMLRGRLRLPSDRA